jgi:hypothetical protein
LETITLSNGLDESGAEEILKDLLSPALIKTIPKWRVPRALPLVGSRGKAPAFLPPSRRRIAVRDFDDAVDVQAWGGDVFGVEVAGSYLDLAHAVCDAAGVPRKVEFVDMPEALLGQYQSFTEAPMTRLRTAGYNGQFTPLEEGVRRYVQEYLTQPDRYV